MKRTLTLITLLLALLPAEAQVRIVHKGAMTGSFKPGHPGGTAAEKEAIDLAAHFFLAESLTRTAPWAKAIRKGDIVLCETDTEDYGEDGCRIVIDNRNVRIYGHGKGLVYGTVEFLKKYVGIDYWGAGESYEPLHKELVLDPVDTVITPTFRYRQSQNYLLRTDPLYKTWYHLEEPSEVFVANYWVHTCNRLLPASRYGAEHPEYYAYYNGKRNPGSASQWCMSNPEVLEIVCQRLDSLFKAYPDRKMISISQNDGSDTYCRCPECTRIMEEEGGPSGPILRFINAVADRFPDKEISTLAYLFSVQPPRKTVPRENVSIMLCDIDCRRQTALTENPSGQEFMKALEGWSKICKNLFVWDYGINFDNYLSPFPNLSTIKDNMVIFRDHHVKMHFSQIASVRGGDFAELRSYLVNNLMWDAGASLDSLEQRFLTRYYGKAGWPIFKYIKLMEGAAVGTDVDLFIYDSPVSYKDNILRPELMRRYNALFDEAEAAVAGDPVRLARVRRTRLPLQYSALEIARTEPDRDPEAIGRALDLFQDRTLEFEVEMLNERHNTDGVLHDVPEPLSGRFQGQPGFREACHLPGPAPPQVPEARRNRLDGRHLRRHDLRGKLGRLGRDRRRLHHRPGRPDRRPQHQRRLPAPARRLDPPAEAGEIQRLPGRGALPVHRRHRHSGEPRHRGGLRSGGSPLRLRSPLHPGGHNGRQNLPRVALRRRQPLLVLPRRGDRTMTTLVSCRPAFSA